MNVYVLTSLLLGLCSTKAKKLAEEALSRRPTSGKRKKAITVPELSYITADEFNSVPKWVTIGLVVCKSKISRLTKEIGLVKDFKSLELCSLWTVLAYWGLFRSVIGIEYSHHLYLYCYSVLSLGEIKSFITATGVVNICMYVILVISFILL